LAVGSPFAQVVSGTAAGCTPGAVTRLRSGRRRGTVVSFNPRAGSRLSPRTVVAIQVSRGRR
jgi:beta-lactam-binding protein with PASTA domain